MRADVEGRDLRTLRGRELIQVCIGKYQIQLHFFPQATITIEQCFDLTLPDGRGATQEELSHQARELVSILGGKIETADMMPDDTLQVGFGCGHIIRVPKSTDGYESYQITVEGLNLCV